MDILALLCALRAKNLVSYNLLIQNMTLVVDFLVDALYQIKEFSFFPSFLRVFFFFLNHERLLNFVKSYFCFN